MSLNKRPPVTATNELPLRLVAPEEWSGYRIVDARGRNLCALFNWYEEGGVQHNVPDEEVRAVGEWIVASLNATLESNERSDGGLTTLPDKAAASSAP
jgi:hypothetical protein